MNNKVEMTKMEKEVLLEGIIKNEYSGLNGCLPETVEEVEEYIIFGIWTDCVYTDNIKGKVLGGVLSSMVQKGIIKVDNSKDGGISLTELGAEIVIEILNIKK